MKPRIKFLPVLFVVLVLSLCSFAFAQKGGKKPPPPPPPPTPSDPAIAYITGGTFGGNLMVMNADGSNQVMLLDDSEFNNADPSWSPDGSQLVFVRYHLYQGAICIINKNGGTPSVLLSSDHYEFGYPEWSPQPLGDGHHKILYRDADPGGHGDLYLMNVDGTGIVNITNTTDDEFYPSWSPDGSHVAAMVYHPDLTQDIVVYEVTFADLDGDGVSTFTATNPTYLTGSGPLNGATLECPSWTKTGNRILVSALLEGDTGGWRMWVIDVANPAQPTQILPPSSANPFMQNASADDSRIVYRYNAPWTKGKKGQSGIFVMNSDGTGATNSGYPADGNWPDWRRCCPECEVVCAQ